MPFTPPPMPTPHHAQPPHHQHPHQSGLLATAKSTLPSQASESPVVFLRIHSWCCTFYGFGQKDNDMGASHGNWWLSGKSTRQCRRHRKCRFDPCVWKMPWRRKGQPTPVFLPGKSHGQRSLAGYSPRGRKELDMT